MPDATRSMACYCQGKRARDDRLRGDDGGQSSKGYERVVDPARNQLEERAVRLGRRLQQKRTLAEIAQDEGG
jgi:hypothetical protein